MHVVFQTELFQKKSGRSSNLSNQTWFQSLITRLADCFSSIEDADNELAIDFD